MFNAISFLGQSLFPLESLESKFLRESINGSTESLRNLYHEAEVLNIKKEVINVQDLRGQSALHLAIKKVIFNQLNSSFKLVPMSILQ